MGTEVGTAANVFGVARGGPGASCGMLTQGKAWMGGKWDGCSPREDGRRWYQKPCVPPSRTETNSQVWARDLSELQDIHPQRKRPRSPHTTRTRVRHNTGQGCAGSQMAGRGESGVPGPNALGPAMNIRPKEGSTAWKTIGANATEEQRQPVSAPDDPPPGHKAGDTGRVLGLQKSGTRMHVGRTVKPVHSAFWVEYFGSPLISCGHRTGTLFVR